MGLSVNRQCQIVGALVLALLCVSAALTQADERFKLFNKTELASMARLGRSAVWVPGQPFDRHLAFYAVDSEEDTAREDRGVSAYGALCRVQKKRELHEEPGYEFLPPFYDETTCSSKRVSFIPRDSKARAQQCEDPYVCVQRFREMFVGRHRIGDSDDCWKLVPVIIPSGCECMTPHNRLGDLE